MKKLIIIILIILYSLYTFGQKINLGENPSSFLPQPNIEIPPEHSIAKQSIQESPFQQTSILPNNNNELDGATGLAQNILTDTITRNALGEVTGIAANDVSLFDGFFLEFKRISSALASNLIPTLNLVDDSLTSFILDQNEFASVSQLTNGLISNEYKSTLSKGAQLVQAFKDGEGQILFTATDDASLFIKKGNKYEFENGILVFVNKNYREILETNLKSFASLDINTGFINIRLSEKASYSYQDLNNLKVNFKIQNKNPERHDIKIKKRLIDTINNTDYINLLEHSIQLTGLMNFFVFNPLNNSYSLIYESRSELNKASLDLDNNNEIIKLLFLDTSSKSLIANIHSSYYKIREIYDKKLLRYITIGTRNPNVIKKYKIILDPLNEITISNEEELFQDNNYNLIAQNTQSHDICSELLKKLLKNKDETFLNEC